MENTALVGKKISAKKKLMIAWILVIVLCVSFIVYLAVGYKKYRGYQEKCVALMEPTASMLGVDTTQDEDAYLKYWYDELKPKTFMSYGLYPEETINRLNESRSKAIAAAKELFVSVGYPKKWQPAYVFAFHGFLDYCIGQVIFTDAGRDDTTIINIALLSIIRILFFLTLITQIINSNRKKQRLTVDDRGVHFGKKKKETDIEASRISSVQKTCFHGVKITSPGKKIKVSMLENQVEIIDRITDMINNGRANAPDPYAAAGNPSSASQLREWKELLDSGVITQEEYEEKKKTLLLS